MPLTTAGPTSTHVPRWQRMVTPSVTSAGIAVASLALHLRDPHSAGSWGECPLLTLTGIYCPGCGGLRAVNDLGDGHLGAALSSNLMFTVLAPILLLALLLWGADRWRGVERHWSRRAVRAVVAALVVALVVFSVGRNLAVGAWLAP